MIEKTILDYLKTELEVPVYMEVPENPPKRYVLIEKTGSNSNGLLYDSTLAIQSYGESLYSAAELSQLVIGAMYGAVHCDDVTHSELNSEYNFTDPTTKHYRYQAVFFITHY